jgi:hypothetical protein
MHAGPASEAGIDHHRPSGVGKVPRKAEWDARFRNFRFASDALNEALPGSGQPSAGVVSTVAIFIIRRCASHTSRRRFG